MAVSILDEISEKLDSDYLTLLIDLLKTGVLAEDVAKTITQEFLTLSPYSSLEDIKTKLKKFTDSHREFVKLYIDFLHQEEKNKVGDVLNKMRSFMKEDKIDEALKLTKSHG